MIGRQIIFHVYHVLSRGERSSQDGVVNMPGTEQLAWHICINKLERNCIPWVPAYKLLWTSKIKAATGTYDYNKIKQRTIN